MKKQTSRYLVTEEFISYSVMQGGRDKMDAKQEEFKRKRERKRERERVLARERQRTYRERHRDELRKVWRVATALMARGMVRVADLLLEFLTAEEAAALSAALVNKKERGKKLRATIRQNARAYEMLQRRAGKAVR